VIVAGLSARCRRQAAPDPPLPVLVALALLPARLFLKHKTPQTTAAGPTPGGCAPVW
jgi:hypothetical protein